MRRGRMILALAVLAGAVGVAGAYAPERAEQIFPGAGDKARQLRAALPEQIFTRLDEYLPASLKSAQPQPAQAAVKAADGAPAKPGASAADPAPKPAAGAPPPRPPVSITTAQAAKKPVAARIDAIGTVQPMASVSLRSRVDTQIDKILVADGAAVMAGDALVLLDKRQIEAQLRQADATLAKDQAALDQAQRDVARFTELVAKQATIKTNLDNARTLVASTQALIAGDIAAIENLRVQITYYTIKAPISGRIGAFTTKAGNLARAGEAATALATINQTSPIYVNFSVPQRLLADLREAIGGAQAKVEATPQGAKKSAQGRVALIDNAIDASTGTIQVRAQFDNADEFLWPGQLCNIRVILRTDADVVTVPREAVQIGQSGNFVYIVENGTARVRPVTVDRVQDADAVIADGLKGGETIVLDGALLLTNNARVEVRAPAPKKSAS